MGGTDAHQEIPVTGLLTTSPTRNSTGNLTAKATTDTTSDSRALVLAPGAGTIRPKAFRKLIVIGFVGGHVRCGNLVHKEVLMARDLRERYPSSVHATVFANRDGAAALRKVLRLLDTNGDGRLSVAEKRAARIVIYGHSWGASETVALARRLNRLGIPVLLTVQVDSVDKHGERDGLIPPNVHEAINFFQSEGLLHGRASIRAMNPKRTLILGNFKSSYRKHHISCARYPWYARAFMGEHIEIENDPAVWTRIEALVQTEITGIQAEPDIYRP